MGKAEIDLAYVARLARLRLTEDEIVAFGGQLEGVLRNIESLSRLDIEGIEPTAHASPIHNVFRSDEPRPGASVAAALSNAPLAVNDLFITPKIIE